MARFAALALLVIAFAATTTAARPVQDEPAVNAGSWSHSVVDVLKVCSVENRVVALRRHHGHVQLLRPNAMLCAGLISSSAVSFLLDQFVIPHRGFWRLVRQFRISRSLSDQEACASSTLR